jgi:oligosaccharide repeat unit polymerase
MGGPALVMLACAYVVAAIFGIVRYRSPLNPLTFTAVVGGGITLMSGAIVYAQLESAPYSDRDVAFTALMCFVALLGAATPYLFHGRLLARVFGQLLRWLNLDSEVIATRFNPVKFGLLIVGAVACYAALAVVGGGGLRWLTDTRGAYIENRAGAGPFFAATEWLLVIALLYYLWSHRPRRLSRILPVAAIFAIAANMTGSKGNVLIMVVVLVAYYQFRIRPIPIIVFVVMIPLFLAVFGALLLIQGFEASNAFLALVYFKDYFDTSAQFLARFDEFGFRYGGAAASELWFYVPRGLYPSKPYEYGATLIHQVLFPGGAESGNTPGYLPWAPAYLDFGVVGVYMSGVFGSFIQRGAYECYLRRRRSFIAFILMMQFALWAPLAFATPSMAVVLCVVIVSYFRLTVRRRDRLSRIQFPSANAGAATP